MIKLRLAAVLAVLCLLILAGWVFYLHGEYREFRTKVETLSDVRLGESREEILYRFGEPESVENPVTSDFASRVNATPIWVRDGLPAGRTIQDYGSWNWTVTVDEALHLRQVWFDQTNDSVDAIWCSTSGEVQYAHHCITAGGIGTETDNTYDSWPYFESDVIDQFGEPSRIDYQEVQRVQKKILSYETWGLEFILIGGEVVGISKSIASFNFFTWLSNGRPSAFGRD